MSRKFNAHGYRTVALSGKDSEEKRQEAFERLAMEETDATQEMQPLDFIFSFNNSDYLKKARKTGQITG